MTLRRATERAIGTIPDLPWHPFLLVIAFIADPVLANGLQLSIAGRALAVGIAAVLVILVIARSVTGWGRGGLVTSAAVVLMTTRESAGAVLAASAHLPIAAAVGLGLALVVLVYLSWRIVSGLLRRWDAVRRVTRGLNLIGCIVVALVLARGLSATTVAATDLELEAITGTERPDIYVLLLDGYPRADTLASDWAYDNSSFLEELRARGFDVSESSRANYLTPRLTAASVLNMRLVHQLPAFQAILRDEASTQATLQQLINQNEVFARLRSAGYRISATAPGIEVVSLRSADRWMEGPQLNELEYRLLELTYVTELLRVFAPDFLSAEHRGRIEFGFQAMKQAAAEHNGHPDFVWGHILSPHMPPVYGPSGEPVTVPYRADFFADAGADRDMTGQAFREAYRNHLTHLNRLTLETVDGILTSAEAPPVILIFSDHGSGARLNFGDQEHSDYRERARNFFAAYTPGRDNLFPDDTTPVNLFPILFNEYLETDYPLAPDATFVVTTGGTVQAVDVDRPPD